VVGNRGEGERDGEEARAREGERERGIPPELGLCLVEEEGGEAEEDGDGAGENLEGGGPGGGALDGLLLLWLLLVFIL
jgi:hypothetical protein